MWNSKKSNVLIVQSDNGDVFIVEDAKAKSSIQKILDEEREKASRTPTRSTRKRPVSESEQFELISENEK